MPFSKKKNLLQIKKVWHPKTRDCMYTAGQLEAREWTMRGGARGQAGQELKMHHRCPESRSLCLL